MKTLVVLVVLVVVVQAARVPRQGSFTTKYDGVDLQSILKNDRLRKGYLDCLLERTAHCSPDAKTLKESIPNALTNDCANCSERQKQGTMTVIEYLRENKPEELKLLTAKYDPQGIYSRRYAQQQAKN